MTTPSEYTLAEKPCVDALLAMGYEWLRPSQNDFARDGQNQVILRDTFIEAIGRINSISAEVARAVYVELLNITDNEQWTSLMRGNYSRNMPGEATRKTIRLIDFLTPRNNKFTVTNQLRVRGLKNRVADVVIYVNGLPLVVIEAKKPFVAKDKTGEAFEQIKQYERDIPRLFYTNVFSIITDGVHVLYGATGASSEFWSEWKDPWPKRSSDFPALLEQSLYCLLEPNRLLDLLAHFIVFEKREESVVKKICRYQQFRAVNKIVERVLEGKHRRGLIWHTQGSGKSLTMAFATLKLKTHLTINHPALASPNILVLTDRIDLDDQISKTFEACGLPNPKQIKSIPDLHEGVHSGTSGLVMLSTIFKFEGSRKPVANSADWIVLVDECHRTQEKDLGAYLRVTLPHARFFGFTGTPIKKTDLNTYENFGIPGEGYLDRYSIDDAVADGATVPIRYTSRKTEWHLEGAKLDVLFDQWFTNESEERIRMLKERGATIAELAKHRKRVEIIAYDIWNHFRAHAEPDGYKAQLVAIDREAVILYKRALDKIIAEHLEREGHAPEEASRQAETMSACVYSSNQEDAKPSEDDYTDDVRRDLTRYFLDDEAERAVKEEFKRRGTPLRFLIVCNKLLTGFDAPIESVMYLDNPLKEHNLLQAIARTNRVAGPEKQYGLIVDYIGVTKKLDEVLASYREADVRNAMRDLEVERAQLKTAHAEVLRLLAGISRGTDNIKREYDALVRTLGGEDSWFTFRRKAKDFVRAYEGLSPDPLVLSYTGDLKWVAGFLAYGTQVFEKKEALLLNQYSSKIRQMLDAHLHITGISTICKLRRLTDPEFWEDFDGQKPEEELVTAAIRKSTELKKILAEKVAENPLRYGPFSERVLEILRRFEANQIAAAVVLQEYEKVCKELDAEQKAHEGSGLDERTYGIYKILEAFNRQPIKNSENSGQAGRSSSEDATPRDGEALLIQLAKDVDDLYGSDKSAPPNWHLKEQLRKELRQLVRRLVHQAGLDDLKAIPERIEEYALKNYVKVA
jgi:type I restriction enzyme R subunit